MGSKEVRNDEALLINRGEVKKLLKTQLDTDDSTLERYVEAVTRDAESIVLSLIKATAHRTVNQKTRVDTKA